MNKRIFLMSFMLLIFSLTLGRQTALAMEPAPSSSETDAKGGDYLLIYVTHLTFRCFECLQIEAMARELLDMEFSDYLEAGRIKIVAVDYGIDESFAAKYEIASSTLVLSLIHAGEEIHSRRLDEVMSLVYHREAYMEYVRNAIWEQIDQLEEHGR